MNPKQRAAESALQFVKSGMVVGLGTGSTAEYFLQALGAAVREGRLEKIRGIPSSLASERRAQHLGIPLTSFVEVDFCDVYVDGADEVGPNLTVIKGLGGALLREKIVSQNSKKVIIIADKSKEVVALGTKGPLPVEVAPFSHEATRRFLQSLNCSAELRLKEDGSPFVTDNGNYIYHCKFARIGDPRQLENTLKQRAGIMETGLFIDIVNIALIADDANVRTLRRGSS